VAVAVAPTFTWFVTQKVAVILFGPKVRNILHIVERIEARFMNQYYR
jgi:hypothetical protein